jgi:hypothetical protein
MEYRFRNIATAYGGSFLPYEPFPRITDREAWGQVHPAMAEKVVREGERFLGYEFPELTREDYTEFSRTGNRVNFEAKYFARRHALVSLITAECVENQGRFLPDIKNGIRVILEEEGWQLPPHNSYERGGPNLPLPDPERPVLELFSCETGALMALAKYVIGERLNQYDNGVTDRIRVEIRKRILEPYFAHHFWWMGDGDREPMCNWTIWCTQNMLITYFLEERDPEVLHRVLEQACDSIDCFLKDYGEDGCCDEGAMYYRHAGLCLYDCLELLNAVTGDAFAELYRWQKLRNIAGYIANVHVAGPFYFNYADCSPLAGRAGAREYGFGKRLGLAPLWQFAARDLEDSDHPLYGDDVNGASLYHRLQNIFFRSEEEATEPEKPGDLYYESVGVFIARSSRCDLAVKAGDNGDSHNHNDTGSPILYVDGKPVLADIGVESYSAKTFSDRRYEIWTMQSGYHNLPTIGGMDQLPGEEHGASGVEVSFGESESRIEMELSKAYPKNAANPALSYRRAVTLSKTDNIVTILDATNAKDVILNFILSEEPIPEGNSVRIGSTARLEWQGAELLAMEVLPITDARLKLAWDHDLYRLRLKNLADTVTIAIKPLACYN